jgi:hexokinase
VDSQQISLGFTFSFPVEQTALDSGKLLTWTKGFAARNTVGNDVVKLLQDAFDRKHLHVKCVALVNDVRTPASSTTWEALTARADSRCAPFPCLHGRRMRSRSVRVGCFCTTPADVSPGAIFGTGTNGAYVESVQNITKLQNSAAAARGGDMVVNTEWGGFNNSRSRLPTTPWDNKLDRESINPRFQAYEKFISGMYLGEITRNVLLSLVDAAPAPLLFGGRASSIMNTHYGLDTAVMSAVELAWADAGKPAAAEFEDEEHAEKAEEQPASNAAQPGDAHMHEDLTGAVPLLKHAAASGIVTTASDATASAPEPELNVPALFANPEALDSLSKPTRARLEAIRAVIVAQLGYAEDDVSLRDAAVVRWVAGLVANRAAKLAGCAVAAVAVQTGRAKLGAHANAGFKGAEKIAVGVDGSLIQHYPNFEVHLRESVRALVGAEVEKVVEIGMAKDGSGVGGKSSPHSCRFLCR